jgi:ferredoxin-thioredoxin reductase catalytic subunit
MDEKELIEKSKQHADSAGISLNPDEQVVNGVIKGLLRNRETKGELYCPCRMVTGNKDKDAEIVCPCVYHRGEIELQGFCHCRLFVKKE